MSGWSTTALPPLLPPRRLARLRYSSVVADPHQTRPLSVVRDRSSGPPSGGEGGSYSNNIGACVDPVFSDYEDEDGGDADGGDADYKNGEVTKRAKKVKAVKNNKKRAVDPVFSDDDDDNDEDDRDEDYKDEEVGKKKAKVKAVKNHNKKKAVTNKKKRTKEEDQAVVDAVAS